MPENDVALLERAFKASSGSCDDPYEVNPGAYGGRKYCPVQNAYT